MKTLVVMMLLIPGLCFGQSSGTAPKGQATPDKALTWEQIEKQHNDLQIKTLKSKKIIVCYALKKNRFDRYVDLDTVLACPTHDNFRASATLDDIYSWGFKLIQVVYVPPGMDSQQNETIPLYYFDKR